MYIHKKKYAVNKQKLIDLNNMQKGGVYVNNNMRGGDA